jgi:hypothetical protein
MDAEIIKAIGQYILLPIVCAIAFYLWLENL